MQSIRYFSCGFLIKKWRKKSVNFSMYFYLDYVSINIVMESLDKISLLLSEALSLLNEYREDKLKDLSSIDKIEWTQELKDILVKAILSDTISFNDAVARYNLVPEELDNWFPLFD